MDDESKESNSSRHNNLFEGALFDVEHALVMHATSFCTFLAEEIYDSEKLASLNSVIETCHIYLIGYTPMIYFICARQEDDNLLMHMQFEILGNQHTLSYGIPKGLSLKHDRELAYLEDVDGRRHWPSDNKMQLILSAKSKAVTFDVKYVGQAYGQDGSRNPVDRLLKHETLQKIALKQAPSGYRLTVLLLAVQPDNQVITQMNPFAKNRCDGGERIKSGLDKLFNTTEPERITLYEAALIRYFCPEYNKVFKNSFPSTRLKILQDCYEKDFSAVIAEISINELPFRLFSQSIEPDIHHFAVHNLHKNEDRRMFFGL